ncbi:MAG TPA: carboxypeptidase regulatory-like domain-containing protein [Candidatus Koribacter sp.]|jgi:hypothetical protein
MKKSFQKGSWTIASLIVVLLAFAFTAMAQTSNGTIAGVVTDSTGAAVTNATVVVTNVQTGETHKAGTNSVGAYRFDSVLPGIYNVAVTAPGFAETKLTNLTVNGSVITSANATVRPGAQETLTVEAEGQTLQTETGEISNTISTREVQDLPIQGFNPYSLATTLPGVTTVTSVGLTNGTAFSVFGTRPRADNFLIEGSDNNDAGIAGQGLQPENLDAIKEVTFLTNSYDAEWGHGGGSVSNLIFKSGTNNWHGAGWDRILNSSLDANDKSAPIFDSTKAKYRENLFGFDIGGPVIKDKLFVFGSYQWDKWRSTANLGTLTVPTAAGVAVLQSLEPNTQIANYLQAIGSLRGVSNFTNIPLGNDPNTDAARPDVQVGDVQRSLPAAYDNPEMDLKGDYLPTQKDTISLRYIKSNFTAPYDIFNYPDQLAGFDTTQYGESHNAGVTWTHNLTNSMLNELRASYGRIGFTFDFTPQTYANPLALGPTIDIAGVSGFGAPSGDPQGRFHNTYQLQDALSWTKGKHFFKFGFDVENVRVRDAVPFNFYGAIGYNPAPGTGYTGLADYIDDYSGTGNNSVSQNFGSPIVRPNLYEQAYYFQDTWKLRPNLTVNYGLRYEYSGAPANDLPYPAMNMANWDDIATRTKEIPDSGEFGPRFGFAYTPRFWQSLFGDNKTVIRGGFGIFYDGIFTNIVDNIQASSPNAASPQIFAPASGGRGYSQWSTGFQFLDPTPSPFGTADPITPHLLSPETLQWNLNVERELPGHMVATLGYIGTRGEHLFANSNINPVLFSTGSRLDENRGFIVLRDNTGDSVYHGLIAELERQFAHGLLFRASYTWSRFEDDSSEIFTAGNWSSYPSVSYPEDRKLTDWGLSAFDHRQRMVFTYVYDVPKWHAESALAKGASAVTNGWQVMGVTSFQTGNPYNPEIGYDWNGDGISNDRPNIGNPAAPLQNWAVDGAFWFGAPAGTLCEGSSWWNTGNDCKVVSSSWAHWVLPAFGSAGNASRNSLMAPGYEDWDFGIQRTIKVHESQQFDFRAEMFNVFNHGNTGTPTASLVDEPYQTPGQPAVVNPLFNYPYTVTGHRNIRFYLKYSF